jgi:FkbM family methyltransferase
LNFIDTIYHRIGGLAARNYRAWQLGLPLARSRDFRMPREILFRGQKRAIHVPDGTGATVAFSDIFLNDVYQLRRAKRPISSVIDIGAHAGLFSLFARMLFPGATIHCYEPNPAMHSFLEPQVRELGIQIFPEAVGAAAGTISIVSGEDSVNSSVATGGDIPMVPFSLAVERIGGVVDFLKLDCEGSEWSILKDPSGFKKVRSLGMEYHLRDAHTVDELLATLAGMGFAMSFVERNALTYGMLCASRA